MKKHGFTFLLLLVAQLVFSQQMETPEAKSRRMAWWKDAKFGLFLHWGIYSVAAGEYKGQTNYGEWLMYEAKVPKAEYEQLAPQFNPVQFDADAWVRMAKNAGMKYIVITSKHHDGFCLFDSKVSDYDIVDRTPFRRDPIRELAGACRKYGLKLCFYHSIMDWHHPQATVGAGEEFIRYREEYLKPQLRELLTNYGDIGVLWFDGEWIDEWTEDQGRDLYNYVRSLQPDILINNRVGKGRNGMQGMNTSQEAVGDFGTPEQEILAEKSTLDWESCMTMNDHWGYNRADKNYKSAASLIWNIADVTAKGGNFLLNIGPTAEGTFPPECVERLQEIGVWMAVNQEAVYAAKPWAHWREGEDIRYAQGASSDVYAFVRKKSGKELLLKSIRPKVGSAIQLLGHKKALRWHSTADGIVIQLPENKGKIQPIRDNYPFVLRLQGTPEDVTEAPIIGSEADQHRKNVVFTNQTSIRISAAPDATIYYTTDGSEPTAASAKYNSVLRINASTTVRAMARVPGKMSSESAQLHYEKARYGLRLEATYADKYAALGPLSLVDGVRGSTNLYDGTWLGFEGQDFAAVLDLGESREVKKVGLSFLRVIPSWIFLPRRLEIWGSDDDLNFNLLVVQEVPEAKAADGNALRTFSLPVSGQYRYLRVVAKSQGVCPAWHPGAGGKCWVFADEVWVE